MKLRFRENSLRLRVNRREVEQLAAGEAIEEEIFFPGNARMAYLLESSAGDGAAAEYHAHTIRVSAPEEQIRRWAAGEEIGLYYELPANGGRRLRVAIEKDLECVEGPEAERDPDAFPRRGKEC